MLPLRGIRIGLVAITICGFAGVVSLQAQERDGLWEGRRAVESAERGESRPHAWIRGRFIGPEAARPQVLQTPGGFHPADMLAAYGIPAGGGAGVTIAVVDAYDSPNAAADLALFNSTFGLAPCTTTSGCFTKVNEKGSATSLPRRNSGWEVEINLDVQWAHAIAPAAKILLVEANSANDGDLLTAVDYARRHANVVTMSWGGSEFSSETYYDTYFTDVSTNPGVVFLASSGDTGGVVGWPASSRYVIAVGGTNLAANSSTGGLATPVSETAWNGSGGGCSRYETALVAQPLPATPTCTRRGVPDVAMSGGPTSAVSVYISMQGGWYEVYGTSLASPMYAGVIALTDSSRSSKLSNTQAFTLLYGSGATSSYRDITSGTAGSFSAGPGWDFVTGFGSPLANSLIPYLATH
jgi:subtilase family serine protease